jgi:hypothetical protein
MRQAVYVKGSAEWVAWVNALAMQLDEPVAALVARALAREARRNGHPAPPRRTAPRARPRESFEDRDGLGH